MQKYLLFLFILTAPFGAAAQYEKIDSLKYLLVENSPDSIRTNVYLQLCDAYRYLNKDTSFYFCEAALKIAMESDLEDKEIEIYNTIGYLYLNTGNFPESHLAFQKGLMLSEHIQDTFSMALLSNGLGLAFWRMSKNDEAIKNFQKVYQWGKEIGKIKLLKHATNNLGMISSELGRFDEAIKYFEQLEDIALQMNDEDGHALAILNIAVIYKKEKKYDLALAGFERGVKMMEKMKNHAATAHCYVVIGETLLHQKKYTEALKMINKSIAFSRQYGLDMEEVGGIEFKADIMLALERPGEAIALANEGIIKIKKLDVINRLPEFYAILSKAYEQSKKYKEALEWKNNYVALKDSLFTLERDKEIAQLEISFQTKQKEAENELLKKDKEGQLLLINERTRLAAITGVAVLFFMIIAILLFRARRKDKNIKTLLEKKVKERTLKLEESNTYLRQSNEELTRFAFIASHDLKEPLRNMGGFISLIKRRLQKNEDKELLEYIEFAENNNYQMVDLVDNILEYSKIEIVAKEQMERCQLSLIAKETCDLLAGTIQEKNAQISYEDLPSIYFNSAVIKTLFRNLLENAIKYNQSKRPKVKISYKKEADQFQLMVSDNGIGVAPEYHDKIFDMFVRLHNREEYKGSGMGLAYCKKLLTKYRGTIQVESEVNKGSTFIITIPAKIIHTDADIVTCANPPLDELGTTPMN